MAAHVLIVDDDDGIRLALRMVLEDTSYKVDEAPDGVAALRLITSSADGMVILLDNLMPGLDAGELLATLEEEQRDGHDVGQANGACHTIRHAFILMTASPQRITPVLATRLARLDAPVVAKPFDLSAVLELVACAVARLDQSEAKHERGIYADSEKGGDGAKTH